MGEDRSLICVTFFSLAPFVMSPKSAPCDMLAEGPRSANFPVTAICLLFWGKGNIPVLHPLQVFLDPDRPVLSQAEGVQEEEVVEGAAAEAL
jgi:hypothetical protein